ncbi:MAG: hypothetical protein OEZ10_12000 [Gammaproteobacteria bacterium]|nr:hypothetical protein [Gammaproteobacteria bacterium]
MMHSDRQFDSYLEGGSALSHAYAGFGNELPTEAVDNAILAAARRATSSGPRSGRHGKRSWQVPASIAASMVVAVGMVAFLNQRINGLGIPDSAEPVQTARLSPAQTVQPVTDPAANVASAAGAENPGQADVSSPTEMALAKAAANADEQAVALTQRSMASVGPVPSAQGTEKRLSFGQRVNLLRQGMKPSQVAVLLGEPSAKDSGQWIYQKITSNPNQINEYRLGFNEKNELHGWSLKTIETKTPASH